MTIEIEIICEDERELLLHLTVIREQIKKEIKKQKGELLVPATLKDSNCYGDHTVNIIPECTKESGHFPDGNGFCLSCGDQLGIEVIVK
jgi:hypothetical protein